MRSLSLFLVFFLVACNNGNLDSDADTAGIEVVPGEAGTFRPLVAENSTTGAAFSNTAEATALPVPDAWRPTEDVLVQCPWVSQEYSADAMDYTLNCGPTTLVMASACMNGTTPVTQDIIDVIHRMDDNADDYAGSGENLHGSLTNLDQLTQTMEGYYGISAEKYGMSYGTDGLAGLYEDLQNGIPALIITRGQWDNETDIMQDDGGGHFMLLVGMTPTHIIVNDPGPWDAQYGANKAYTISSFETEWLAGNAGLRFSEIE
ncbi:MAG: C39 family peptidase [Patescibacteria group bacterium]|jgi:hypothetical protein